MPDILHQVTIKAAPDKVYQALTEQKGLEAWWPPRAVAEPKVGSTLDAIFAHGTFVIKMDVAKLDPTRKVEWHTVQGLPDWGNTRVTWDLTPVENGTQVLFGHRGFATAEGSLPQASYDWATFLRSLRDYLEKGQGNPGGDFG